MPTTQSSMVTTDPANASPRLYGTPQEVAPDVFMHPAFVNTYALRTPVGLLLVDPGLGNLADSVHQAVRGWSDAPLHTAVYTHGHADHAFGLRPFLKAGERPQIVAQENCVQRFHRYHLTHGWNACINQRQFSLPEPAFPDHFDWPTLTFRTSLSQRLGDLDVHYFAAKGETDDACYVWIPAHRYLFVGDLIIWQAPNCGNPQKVQRYPLEWANALEEMAGFDAEWLFPGHGIVVHGADGVRMVLTETARYLRIIIDQVLERMNAGQTPEDIFHAVEPDPELAKRPFLHARYDHPKFIVRNLLRLWGGWWNGNAADLLPATWAAQAAEIAAVAGGVGQIVERGRALLDQGNAVLAAHLAEWATRAAPGDRAAQTLKRDVYAQRLREAESLMAQGIYRAAMNDARQALGQPPETGSGLGMGLEQRR
ncbi:MAG TPA: alkyl sulfatase dimerization domain-containing protein [Candidatus Margulisiibacteriota bacterium]|nr:alkyl sulfatase dimerization domain-containing protein [Candidatus Margulisiibacteriota bacterium]